MHIKPRSEAGTPSSEKDKAPRPPLHAVFNSLQECSSASRRADAHPEDDGSSFAIAAHRRTNSATLPLVGTALQLGSGEMSGSRPRLRRHLSEAAASATPAEQMLPLEMVNGGPRSLSFGGGGEAGGGSPERWFGRRRDTLPPQLRNVPRSPASPQVHLNFLLLDCVKLRSLRSWSALRASTLPMLRCVDLQMVVSPAVGAAMQVPSSTRRYADADQPLMLSARVRCGAFAAIPSLPQPFDIVQTRLLGCHDTKSMWELACAGAALQV